MGDADDDRASAGDPQTTASLHVRPDNPALTGCVGLGFRAALAESLLAASDDDAATVEFIEIAPENYLGVGGRRGRHLAMARARFPVVSHGLCGDFSGAAPVDDELLEALGGFLRDNGARWYSDHLCLTHIAGGESHDLLPLPYSEEAITRVAARVRLVGERLGLPIAVENVSAYLAPPTPEGAPVMDEASFINAVVDAADCRLLLDVNNVYVNAVNTSGPDEDPLQRARAVVDALPLHRVVQMHIAGHYVEARHPSGAPSLVIDTHGADVIDPVFGLLRHTLQAISAKGLTPPPVLLERDHNIPALPALLAEMRAIKAIVAEVFP